MFSRTLVLVLKDSLRTNVKSLYLRLIPVNNLSRISQIMRIKLRTEYTFTLRLDVAN